MVTKGEMREESDKLGDWDQHIHTTIHKKDAIKAVKTAIEEIRSDLEDANCDTKILDNVAEELEDYMTVNKNNQKIGVGCCIFGIIDFLFLSGVCFFFYIKLPKYEFLNNRN